MQTQQQRIKNKKLLNILMVAMIAVIAFCAVMATGHIKGWLGSGDSDSAVITEEIKGIANIERSGVGYSLKEKVPLKAGDIVATETGSTVQTRISDDNQLTLNESAELAITSSEHDNIALDMTEGELFADAKKPGKKLDVALDKNTVHAAGSGKPVVFAASQQKGSTTLSVMKGSLDISMEDGTDREVKAGESLLITRDSDGKLSADISKLKAESLDDFLLAQAASCDSKDDLCFTVKEIKAVASARAQEKQEAQEAAAKEGTLNKELTSSGSSKSGSSSTSGSSSASAGSSGSDSSSASGSSSGKGGSSSSVKSCTIQIRCDTILKHMDELKAGKSKYVPSNGVILATSKVEFADGETVFDVLKRACSYTGIQLEYSYTPMYGSYYIEGINHLYEFDCGSQSGWTYKVNGWFPNYGCSSYKLKNGDVIAWCYTCTGLGADVGGGM